MEEVPVGEQQAPVGAGVSGVDELWSRFRQATRQAQALAASNRELSAQVRAMERQLADAGGLTEDELVAELPRRMSRALESAQEVAEELVGRAKKREAMIRQKTDQRATALITHAEAEATAILRRAAAEAVGRVSEAKANAEAIVRAAYTRHDQVLGALGEQVRMADEQARRLRQDHAQLAHACDAVERALAEARAGLRSFANAGGAGAGGGGEAPAVRPAPEHGAPPVAQLYAVKSDDAAVYDWSPPSSGTA